MPDAEARQRSIAERYLAALLQPDPPGAREVVREAVDSGLAVSAAFSKVIAPALEEVGRLWETGEIGVAHEHLAAEVSSSLVDELAQRIRRRPTSGRLAVVVCSPGERHSIGGQMLTALLEAGDWEVLFLGASCPAAEIARLVDRERPDVVAISTTVHDHLPGALETVARLRRRPTPPLVIAGGRAYRTASDARGIGADAWAPTALAATAVLEEHVPIAGP